VTLWIATRWTSRRRHPTR